MQIYYSCHTFSINLEFFVRSLPNCGFSCHISASFSFIIITCYICTYLHMYMFFSLCCHSYLHIMKMYTLNWDTFELQNACFYLIHCRIYPFTFPWNCDTNRRYRYECTYYIRKSVCAYKWLYAHAYVYALICMHLYKSTAVTEVCTNIHVSVF